MHRELIGSVATIVTAAGSWIPSLWGDEATSAMSSERSIPSLFRMLGSVDAVHDSYYLFLHFWIGACRSSPFSVRLPAAIAVGHCRRRGGVRRVDAPVSPSSTGYAHLPGRTCRAQRRHTQCSVHARPMVVGHHIHGGAGSAKTVQSSTNCGEGSVASGSATLWSVAEERAARAVSSVP